MPSKSKIMELLSRVRDPEIPVLTVEDMGVIRSVEIDDNHVTVKITPTYSGCPAMDVIEKEIRAVLTNAGVDVEIQTILAPPWTTDWISSRGKEKLLEVGIVPPQGSASKLSLLDEEPQLICPKCKSENTQVISHFGSTACKALWKCNDCLDPFEYFKCL